MYFLLKSGNNYFIKSSFFALKKEATEISSMEKQNKNKI